MPNPSETSAPAPQESDPAGAGSDQRKGTFIENGTFHGPVIGYQENCFEEPPYLVAGLRNPYLGLQTFTAADRDIFAGRERMVEVLVQRLADDSRRLLFLVGASGSGKSSLARAGVIPALEERLRERRQAAETHILDHPGRTPGAALARLLHTAPAPPAVTLLLIDQFEEIFNLAEPDEARRALDMLLALAAQSERPVRIIAAMRSDFLPLLAADARFEPYERGKVMLRAMAEAELQDAIQRPLQVRHPDRRMEPALVERLARDAAQDAAYLPLLQVTLEDLWRGGSLQLGAYDGLVDAIKRRAEDVFAYRDRDGLRQEPRRSGEQEALLALLLDLVRVSPGEELRETRWRRTRAELAQGDPERERLITDLTAARLLRTDREIWVDGGEERSVETVDVVHEALLSGWPRLKEAIEKERDRLRQRERFLLALHEWRAKAHHSDYLLRDVRLAEAEALKQRGDRVLSEPTARRFYEASLLRRGAEREQQLRRTRCVAAGLGTLALIALLAAGAAGWFGRVAQQRATEASNSAGTAVAEQRRADTQAATAVALLKSNFVQRLAAQADSQRQTQPDLALLLAVEANKRSGASPETYDATLSTLYGVIATNGSLKTMLRGQGTNVTALAFDKDGNTVISGDNIGRLYVWSIANRSLLYSIDPPSCGCGVVDIKTSNMAAGFPDGTLRLWDEHGQPLQALGSINKPGEQQAPPVSALAFSSDQQWLAVGGGDGRIAIWNLTQPSAQPIHLPYGKDRGHTAAVTTLAFSPDGRWLASGNYGQGALAFLWDVKTGTQRHILLREGEQILSLAFSPDSNILAGGGEQSVYLWDVATGQQRTRPLLGHRNDVNALAFSPDAHLLASGGPDGVVLWNLETLQPFGQPLKAASLDGSVRDLRFVGNERLIVAHHFSLWSVDLNPRRWLEAACRAANRSLTPDEWRLYIGVGEPADTCAGVLPAQ